MTVQQHPNRPIYPNTNALDAPISNNSPRPLSTMKHWAKSLKSKNMKITLKNTTIPNAETPKRKSKNTKNQKQNEENLRFKNANPQHQKPFHCKLQSPIAPMSGTHTSQLHPLRLLRIQIQ